MKKIFTLLAVAAAMTLTAQAETLTFQMGGNDGAVILQDGKFNPLGSFIGNTGTNTIIEVGEVDFATGDAYKAVSIRYANGWSNGGKAIVSVGADADNRTEIARMDLINWNDSYTNFRSLGANLGDVLPTGVQKVYLTFEDRAGNIQDVRFYSEAFTADQFESGSLLKEPYNWTGYADMATVLDINNSELVYSSSDETRIDNGSWGWTGEGVIVKYGDLDFGNGDYKQVVLELASHWQGDQSDHSVDVYIDDYSNDANKIANVWTGIDVKAKLYLARNIEAISGTHTVYLQWHGGSANIANVHFVKDYLYSLGNICDPVMNNKDNYQPSENAARYSFRDAMKNT
ncbi:MAG: carbohydrate-binding protein, partial [Muribaculaceae bacterium]|nr:carbohydrate-binding protein [Muribaculaceae bacterium]